MKKSLCVAAVAALFCASSVMAATLKVRIVETGSQLTSTDIDENTPTTVDVQIQAALDGTEAAGSPTSDGLAIIGLNVKQAGDAAIDLCDTSAFLVVAPAAMQAFDRKNTAGAGFTNDGLTNPSGSPNISGYSGTCDGAAGLLQIGGGQNTIGNTVGGAPYPVGAVVSGRGNSGWQVIATGSIDVPAMADGESVTLTPDTVFANTLDNFAGGSPFAVSEVLSGDIAVEGLTINAMMQGIICAAHDVNCDGSTNAGDIGIVASGQNFAQNPPACDRADVDGSGGAVNPGDIGVIASGANFGTSTGPCVCVTSTPVACGVAP